MNQVGKLYIKILAVAVVTFAISVLGGLSPTASAQTHGSVTGTVIQQPDITDQPDDNEDDFAAWNNTDFIYFTLLPKDVTYIIKYEGETLFVTNDPMKDNSGSGVIPVVGFGTYEIRAGAQSERVEVYGTEEQLFLTWNVPDNFSYIEVYYDNVLQKETYTNRIKWFKPPSPTSVNIRVFLKGATTAGSTGSTGTTGTAAGYGPAVPLSSYSLFYYFYDPSVYPNSSGGQGGPDPADVRTRYRR